MRSLIYLAVFSLILFGCYLAGRMVALTMTGY
jgi:hypothetical protein